MVNYYNCAYAKKFFSSYMKVTVLRQGTARSTLRQARQKATNFRSTLVLIATVLWYNSM